jgi:ADP-ribosylglycohydrolase
LAGAIYGVEAIPLAWRAALVQREMIEETADALLTEALIALAEAGAELPP